jgi:hypothetical protein
VKKQGAAVTAKSSPTLSLAEFARQVTILCDDNVVRSCMLRLALNLSRAEVDAGIRRDDFWQDKVAILFSDCSYQAPQIEGVQAFLGTNVDTNSPVTGSSKIFRDGAVLKSTFDRTRVLFTTVKSNWNQSGKLDCCLSDIRNYLSKIHGTQEISSE